MLTRRLNVWAPYNDLRREIDRLFDAFTGGDGGLVRSRAFPAVNVWEDGNNLFLEAELPGVAREDLEISAAGNELTIRGRRNPCQGENLVYHRQERGYGEFSRVLTLPVEVDTDKIEATLRDGVLTLTLPKAEAAKARKIEVKTAE
ncbi:MAG TPA: Hsp20/alpha crystallin family protein [Phycisphaerae bacterium]|jgi:HSP20 family protein|nr:Hsp20/alpha crystallin family protein [Phycisphaerae bacterium]HOB73971.1 Hsp20/alpha crystallin family protein [Phycisphaerae bacterium]HOJ55359.1 Hsp20/alpha crystallin family protein [Phycisphaerae bacterium]HOL25112.1 Hsp20/alpha crystallin family protein [Phycisphaerae bacterium]HPP19712.1 Hsp20/alpha crystallin family protein [Phycisphaerae bacterium]